MKKGYYVPENLDLPLLLKENGNVDVRLFKKFHQDKMFYIIDNLHVRRVIQKRENDEYLPLNSSVLEDVLNNRFAKIAKDTLVKIGVLEKESDRCRPKVLSYKYRFTEKYRNSKFRLISPYDSKLLKKLQSHKLKTELKASENRPEISLIKKTLYELSFDVDLAVKFIEANRSCYATDRKLEARRIIIEKFQNRDICLGEPDRQGRLYHLFTGATRDLRPFASWRGQPLYGIDVSACQPAIASILYKEDCEEKDRYKKLMLENEFYNFLNRGTGTHYDLNNSEEKQAFKKLFFRKILFSRINAKETDLTQFFKEQLPILWTHILKEKEVNHRFLARNIQRIEADIMLKMAARRFTERHLKEDVCLVSIHDCLVTTKEHVPELKNLIKEAMIETIGFSPAVKDSPITGNWGTEPVNEDAKSIGREFMIKFIKIMGRT